jgi:nitrite reductase (NADH) small subunit
MSERHWVPVGYADDVPPREGRAVMVGDREIAVFNMGGGFLATDNRCPHKGGPLADGIIAGNTIVCPLHAWRIDMTRGSVDRPAARECVQTFPVRVDNGVLWVGLPDGAGLPADDLGEPASALGPAGR